MVLGNEVDRHLAPRQGTLEHAGGMELPAQRYVQRQRRRLDVGITPFNGLVGRHDYPHVMAIRRQRFRQRASHIT
jgi:hypothetical protein